MIHTTPMEHSTAHSGPLSPSTMAPNHNLNKEYFIAQRAIEIS